MHGDRFPGRFKIDNVDIPVTHVRDNSKIILICFISGWFKIGD
jgi:hypothetical protein